MAKYGERNNTMKNTNSFAGLNGFIWWMGVLENRIDPLKLGRCQVRIFGWHNLQLLDASLNGSKSDKYETDW